MPTQGSRSPQASIAASEVEALLREGGVHVSPADGETMVLVRAGDFFMGRDTKDNFAPDGEVPGRRVTLRPFLIDRVPVTNARYRRFVDLGGYRSPRHWDEAGWSWRMKTGTEGPISFAVKGFDAPDQPAAGVSWFEADAYARWAGKALPTEAQWEKAARGTDGRLFPWGDDLPRRKLLNFNQNVGATTPVGAYPAGVSPYGVLDMAGNVNNWCRDWYWDGFYGYCRDQGIGRDPCLDDDVKDRLGLPLLQRADRGGGFATSFASWEVLAATGRLSWPPSRRHLWNGFRCAIEL